MTTELLLDFYETPNGTCWCWKYGVWSSEEYPTEEAAEIARDEGRLVFSQPDQYDPYEGALLDARVNFDLEPPFDLWLVADAFYCKPSDYHTQVGKVGQFTPPSEARILSLSRSQFEAIAITQSIDETP